MPHVGQQDTYNIVARIDIIDLGSVVVLIFFALLTLLTLLALIKTKKATTNTLESERGGAKGDENIGWWLTFHCVYGVNTSLTFFIIFFFFSSSFFMPRFRAASSISAFSPTRFLDVSTRAERSNGKSHQKDRCVKFHGCKCCR